MIDAYAAAGPKQPLKPFQYEPGPLLPEQLDVEVHYCGLCHSDLSMRDNEWGQTAYPFVPGHEVVGRISAIGSNVTSHKVGDIVGVGWYTHSCRNCASCIAGDLNLCPNAEQTIVHRHGGFAKSVRCHAEWATPLPAQLDAKSAGPLFCGGITVFNPIVQCNVRPTDRVGVIGIGGLGHLALQFLRAWGCEVTAFSSSDGKSEEAKRFGAHHVVNSRDSDALAKIAGSLDFVLSTVNVSVPWDAYVNTLRPRGRLHLVGLVLEPIPVSAVGLILTQKSVSGSPLGSPATTRQMLEFCARHKIAPQIEMFPMTRINEAFERLESGKARYRIVLDARAS